MGSQKTHTGHAPKSPIVISIVNGKKNCTTQKTKKLRFLWWNEMDLFQFFLKCKEKIALCAYEKWKFASLKVGLMTLTQMTPFFLKMKIQNLLSLSGRPALACKTTSFPLFRFFSMKWIWEPRKIVLTFENCCFVVTIASEMKTQDLNVFDAHENVLIYTVLHEVHKIVSRKYLAPIL